MTAIKDRQELHELAEECGWQRRQADRTDFYRRGQHGVEVFFTSGAMKGGSLYENLQLVTYTRDLTTVKGWLRR
jgi:hypothetical protein